MILPYYIFEIPLRLGAGLDTLVIVLTLLYINFSAIQDRQNYIIFS